ncbi:DUF4198 domain-containing protein [Pseudoxanthomonas daejeonensis]|uniref:DUF4198 domain-containing protein n=1 Tax=Pseudoxanthomonas daejeonensis TaxID=266062 RepID=UPI001F547EB6|nr:DUF4198 domain-containing protein [Pseudoxanthomonas daejeonensis]UNK56902.1 DUF4198 domain-containing protein [Pseudoxanthomonas daejeonensis]
MKRSLILAAVIASLAVPFSATAHKAWLRPSQTVLAGTDPWITVDAAVSNDLFYFNHVPLRLDNLAITAPDGSKVEPQNPATGKYRSVFDLQLAQQGTYRLAVVNSGLSGSWEENGKPKRWRGTPATFATEVPKDAKNLQVSQSVGRVETFVTNGSPNDTALKSSGEGLELVPLTHPNDLFAGEATKFRVLVDGQPAEGVEFEIVRGETRYRNAQDEIKAVSDAKGEFAVTWPTAGMYWLEATREDDKTSLPQARKRRLSYVATLEVLPQ